MDLTDTTVTRLPSSSEASPRFKKILYAVGPGDAAGYFRMRRDGVPAPFMMSMAFSEQFFEACATGRQLSLISSHERREDLRIGAHRIENLPRSPLYFEGGVRHHLGVLLYGLGIVARALGRRASVVIADSGTSHWVVFALLRLFRIRVIAVFHNTLWPAGFPPTRRVERILRATDGWFFRHIADACVCVSPECERQIRSLAPRPCGPIYQCRAQYREGFLSQIPPPEHTSEPFRVLYLGRMEAFKGIDLILEAAERLEREFPGRFAWKLVGTGPAVQAFTEKIRQANLEKIVELPGSLPSQQAAEETLAWSHLVVVPTTSAFAEGLAMTAAEAVLAGRPALVSSVVPAAEVLGDAAIVFETGNLDAFVGALRRLAFDQAAYAAAQRATAAARAQFFDRSLSLGTVLEQAITAL